MRRKATAERPLQIKYLRNFPVVEYILHYSDLFHTAFTSLSVVNSNLVYTNYLTQNGWSESKKSSVRELDRLNVKKPRARASVSTLLTVHERTLCTGIRNRRERSQETSEAQSARCTL